MNTMENDLATAAALEEQQQQLEEIEKLLSQSPEDPSLLSLKADLLELIAVTTGGVVAATAPIGEEAGGSSTVTQPIADPISVEDAAQISHWSTVTESASGVKRPLEEQVGVTNSTVDEQQQQQQQAKTREVVEETEVLTQESQPNKKKKKTIVPKEFVVPAHLQPNETDSKAEENRKKRAIKALKNQWRAQRKDQEANKKQKSWQDFQKKKKIGGGSGGGAATTSIFTTSTDEGAKVGVVGGRQLTDFASRKRHK